MKLHHLYMMEQIAKNLQKDYDGIGKALSISPSILSSLTQFEKSIFKARNTYDKIFSMSQLDLIKLHNESQKIMLEANRNILTTFSSMPFKNIAKALEKSKLYASTQLNSISKFKNYIEREASIISSISRNVEHNLLNINLKSIASNFTVPKTLHENIVKSLENNIESYSMFWKQLNNNPIVIGQFNKNLLDISSIELYKTVKLANYTSKAPILFKNHEVAENRINEEKEIVLIKLNEINPEFTKMYKGACQAYNSTNIDKIRHFSVSLRELLTHILHFLSPDKDIKKWSTSSDDYHHQKPKKITRLKYICRNFPNKDLKNIIVNDFKTTLLFMDYLNKLTHKAQSDTDLKQCKYLLEKIEGFIIFIIDTHLDYN